MSLRIVKTDIPDVLIVEPDVFGDERGFFKEVYHEKKYISAGIRARFNQDNHSRSVKGVLRGLHYQLKNPQAKLVFVLKGSVFDVAVDIRLGSPWFGKWTGTVLTQDNHRQMFIPEGFAHGFCVLGETADFIYKCSSFFDPDDDRGILWSDPQIDINWNVHNPVVSEKDRALPLLCDVPEEFLPVYESL